jgi:hypothetical protein
MYKYQKRKEMADKRVRENGRFVKIEKFSFEIFNK